MRTTYQQIFSAEIPSSENIEFEPLFPKFKRLKMTEWVIFFLILFVAGILAHHFIKEIPSWVFAVFYVFWCLMVFYVSALVNLGFKNKGFAICSADVHYKTGWLSRKVISVPICRIQHMEVSQSALGKMWDIAKLDIYTAGDEDLSIRGISFQRASEIKAYLSEKIKEND